MKIIEAMKRVKENKAKIADLQTKISQCSAILSHETPLYPDTAARITEWAQSCTSLTQDNIALLVAIQRTNLATSVSIEMSDGTTVTKSIAEWVWRRREYAEVDRVTFSKMNDRGLKEGHMNSSTGTPIEVKIVRFYNPDHRDKRLAVFRDEPHRIDAALEVVNATTDLVAG